MAAGATASEVFRVSSAGVGTLQGALEAATGSTIGNLTLSDGSITDSSGAISFGNENLVTTGTLGCGAITTSEDLTFTNANPKIVGGDENGFLQLTPGTTPATGPSIVLYGPSSATPNDIAFLEANADRLRFVGSTNTWDFQSFPITTTGAISGAAGTFTGTMDIAGDTIIGSTSVTPDATLHSYQGNSGVSFSQADAFIAENSGDDTRVRIASADAYEGVLQFSTPSDKTGASLRWDYTNDEFLIGSGKAGASTVLRAGDNTPNLTLSGASGSELATFAGTVFSSVGYLNSATNAFTYLGSDNVTNTGANIILKGSTASGANDIHFRAGTSVWGSWDNSATNFTLAGDLTLSAGKVSITDTASETALSINAVAGQNGIDVVTGNLQVSAGFLDFNASPELTIASGVITATTTVHDVDTEGDASSDELNTINGGSPGRILIISAANSSRTVVVKDAVDNILLEGDFSMDNTSDQLMLIYKASFWREVSRSNNT